ncbi:uncharacterized protein V6R79_017454 [Siganus canaliculatus]
MFAGRAASGAAVGSAGGKGGKFSVEELYGFNKKPKVTRGNSGKSDRGDGKKDAKDKEESALASHILEAARRLMERRRLEIYLKECDVTMETSSMSYSPEDSRSLCRLLEEVHSSSSPPAAAAQGTLLFLVLLRDTNYLKVAGDKVAGDKVAGDKVAGDKVAGDKVAVLSWILSDVAIATSDLPSDASRLHLVFTQGLM